MNKKIAIIGMGNICKKGYMPVLGPKKDLDLMLYNRSPEPLAEIQAKYRISYGTNDLDRLIGDRPEGAFVLTASDSHYAIVKRLLESDIDVYVEKPATMTVEETKELAELADQKNRLLMVGFNRRFAPLHRKAKSLWGEKPVGLGIFRKFRSSPAFDQIYNQIYEDTIHQIDLLRFYCGDGQVESVAHDTKDGKLQSAIAVIRLDSGGIGLVETNLQAGGWREHYSLYGEQKSIEIEAFSELSLHQGEEKRHWVEPYSSAWQSTLAGRGFEGEINHFLNCLETKDRPRTSAWDSVKTQELTEAIINQII